MTKNNTLNNKLIGYIFFSLSSRSSSLLRFLLFFTRGRQSSTVKDLFRSLKLTERKSDVVKDDKEIQSIEGDHNLSLIAKVIASNGANYKGLRVSLMTL